MLTQTSCISGVILGGRPCRTALGGHRAPWSPQILLVSAYSSLRHGGVFCDCLVVLFQLNFDFDDFSFEFGDGA